MRTSLTTDPKRGAGYAIIRLDIADLGNVSLPSMPEGYAFSLQRASDALFLAQSGWQESQSNQIPDSVDTNASVLELYVGPHVVDNLDVLDTYRIHLRHISLPASVIAMESLDYSPLKGKEGLATPAPIPVPAPQPAPEASPEPEAEATPEPEIQAEPLPLVTAPLSMDSSPESEKKPLSFSALLKGPLRGLITGSIIFVLLLGVAWGYYHWQQQQNAAKQAESASSAQPAPEAAPATGSPAKAPEDTPAAQSAAPALAPLAQARKQLQQQADPAQHLALARSLQEQKNVDPAVAAQSADAIFLLVEDAAQKGSAEAMLLLAGYFDPVDTNPKGSIQADPLQACHWYRQARAQGQQQPADQALAALRQWAEAAAAQGDAKAKEVLTQLSAK